MTERRFAPTQSRWIYLLLGISVTLPFLVRVPLKMPVSEPVQRAYDRVEELHQERKEGGTRIALIVADWAPATMAEINPQALAFIIIPGDLKLLDAELDGVVIFFHIEINLVTLTVVHTVKDDLFAMSFDKDFFTAGQAQLFKVPGNGNDARSDFIAPGTDVGRGIGLSFQSIVGSGFYDQLPWGGYLGSLDRLRIGGTI